MNAPELLDLPQELRELIFKQVKIDDMKKNMPIEMKYDILMRKKALDIIERERLLRETEQVYSNHMASPDYMTTPVPRAGSSMMRNSRKQILENAKNIFYEVNNDRMIFENIVYRDVARKARILKVENINRFFS